MRIDLSPCRCTALLCVVMGALGTTAVHAGAATGATLGKWTNAYGVTGGCVGGGACWMGGSVGSADCKEANGASCSGQLNSVTLIGPGAACSGTGQTTFTYTSGTLMSTSTIPVTVTMASGVVTVDGSNGSLTVQATFDTPCVPELGVGSTFAVTWSGVVSFASTSST